MSGEGMSRLWDTRSTPNGRERIGNRDDAIRVMRTW
jgi:hypothetical protein